MKKLTSLIVALIFTISIGLAVINSVKSENSTGKQSYVALNPAPPPPAPQKSGTGE
jgi:preprotein translocase subunit SecG